MRRDFNKMSFARPIVEVYKRNGIINLSTANMLNQARLILNSLNTFPNFRTFHVNLSGLEIYNIFYTEKQVRRIDENYLDYSQGNRLRNIIPPFRPPRRLRYLFRKFFSGDTSGNIGESLFVYFLVEEMGLNPYDIGHLRPEKMRGYLTTDYLIWDHGKLLREIIDTDYSLPLYAEVKSSTGSFDRQRIENGLNQLKATMSRGEYGILFLVKREEHIQCYRAYVIPVRC